MRSLLNTHLATLIWIATIVFVLGSSLTGLFSITAGLFGYGGFASVMLGLLQIFGGLVLALIFSGLCFQIMDIRRFTKHMAQNASR